MRDHVPWQHRITYTAIFLHLQMAAVRRLESTFLEVLQGPTALFLQLLGLKQALLRGVARTHLHRGIRLLELVEFLADLDFGGGRHGFGGGFLKR